MKTMFKYATAATLAGALALAAATPSEARDGRNAAAAIGFGAGALVGAAVASSANNGYYYAPSYGYAPGYYADPYAYEPAPVYVEPAPRYYRGGYSGRSDGGYGYSNCWPCY
jgi:hypothetical protein